MTSSLLTVLTPASSRALTTLATVKDEMGITDDAADARLQRWIDEASGRIETYLGRVLVSETVRETFRLSGAPACLRLARRPVTAIASIQVDGVTLATDQYEIDAPAGLLYPVRGEQRIRWFGRTVVVAYTGGYASVEALPKPIETACLGLLRHRWAARDRDPLLRSLAIPGVATEQYWVGAAGESGDIPPEIVALLDPFRTVTV
ncbi:MAG: phage head-tail connector protein [Acetobacteraceae bacterium]